MYPCKLSFLHIQASVPTSSFLVHHPIPSMRFLFSISDKLWGNVYQILCPEVQLFFFFFNFYWSIVDLQCCFSSGVQQSESVIHIHISTLFQILFPYRSLQSIGQSSLCYTAGPCWLSILNIAVCTCQFQTPSLSLHPTLPPVTICSFSKSVSLFLFCK